MYKPPSRESWRVIVQWDDDRQEFLFSTRDLAQAWAKTAVNRMGGRLVTPIAQVGCTTDWRAK